VAGGCDEACVAEGGERGERAGELAESVPGDERGAQAGLRPRADEDLRAPLPGESECSTSCVWVALVYSETGARPRGEEVLGQVEPGEGGIAASSA
jgi:hypothetical protein